MRLDFRLGLLDCGLVFKQFQPADRAGRLGDFLVDGHLAAVQLDLRLGLDHLRLGFGDSRLGHGNLRLGHIDLGLIWRRIDLEQQRVVLDERGRLVADFLQIAGHAGADLHAIDRLDLTGEVGIFDDRPPHGLSDARRWVFGPALPTVSRRQPTAAATANSQPKHATFHGLSLIKNPEDNHPLVTPTRCAVFCRPSETVIRPCAVASGRPGLRNSSLLAGDCDV